MKTDPRLLVELYLKPNETLLWSGRPKQPRLGLGGWLIYLGLYVLCVHDAAARSWFKDDFMRFIDNVLFLFFAFFCLLSWLVTYLRRRKVVYAVTDKRVFMVIDGKPDSLLSFRSINLSVLEVRHESPDGSGDLKFARIERPDKTVEVRFQSIPNVRDVERLIRRTFNDQAGA